MQQSKIQIQELTFIDPKIVGLSTKTKIGKLTEDQWYIVINRKSHVIMKDGERIERIAAILKKRDPKSKVALTTSAPVCSKTTAFLLARGISIKGLKTN